MCTKTPNIGRLNGLTSADSVPKPTGAGTPADALGATKRMTQLDSSSNQSGGISDEVLLERLKEFAAELGRTPTSTEMDEDGPHTTRTYQNHFGSWNEALDEAGLTRNRDRGEPDDHLLTAIRNLASELGEVPTARDMRGVGRYETATYFARFDSWNAALEQAGFGTNQASPGDGEYGRGWNDTTKEEVRDRQGRKCADCGVAESEYRTRTEKRLDVHHIIPEGQRENPAVYNAPRNLVALCRGCHQDRHADD